MSPEIIRWFLAFVVFAHGVGHVMFMPVLTGALRMQMSGHSWLLTDALGDGVVRIGASFAGAVVIAAFVGGAVALAFQLPMWRQLVIGGAILSAALIVLMFDGVQTSGAVSALAFDVVALGALLVAQWPSQSLIGS